MGVQEAPDVDKITVERDEAILVSQHILAMLTRVKNAQDGGGFSQEDVLFLVEKWLRVSLHFQRGGEANRFRVGVVKDARKQVLAVAYSKDGLLRDFHADAAGPVAERFEYDSHGNAKPLKPSVGLRQSLGNLMNHVYNEHEYQRYEAFRDAEDAFLVFYYNYRAKLSANAHDEKLFRQAVARLRHAHAIR